MEDPIVETNWSVMKNLRVIFDTSLYAMLIISDGVLVKANEAAFQIFHTKNRGDIIGNPLPILSPPVEEDRTPSDKGFPSHFQRAISGEIVMTSSMIMEMIEKLRHNIGGFTV